MHHLPLKEKIGTVKRTPSSSHTQKQEKGGITQSEQYTWSCYSKGSRPYSERDWEQSNAARAPSPPPVGVPCSSRCRCNPLPLLQVTGSRRSAPAARPAVNLLLCLTPSSAAGGYAPIPWVEENSGLCLSSCSPSLTSILSAALFNSFLSVTI